MNGKFMKTKLEPFVGKKVKIQYSLGRNKYEKYTGKITQLFPNVFLFEEENGIVKCFSYSDILTKTIRLSFSENRLL